MLKFKSFAKTPPMGWNSWDCFGAAVTEKELKENADFMAKYLKSYGWEYIVCDIQWYEPNAVRHSYDKFAPLNMDEYGRLMPAENRFPSAAGGKGFSEIAKYIHSLGLKFGIHIMRGIPREAVHKNLPIKDSEYTARQAAESFSVCSWNTDMYGMTDCEAAQKYYDSIIEMYASWGVDFIKCDDICVTEFKKATKPYSAPHEIEMLRRAIDKCGRNIVLSLSPGPAVREKAEHLCKNANMWRLTGDVWDKWRDVYEMFSRCHNWEGVRSAGNYPDCDMLPLGMLAKKGSGGNEINRYTNLTTPEQVTLMTLWGIFGSPLIFGGHLPGCDEQTILLLTNEEYIAMDQTSYGAKQLLREESNGQGTIIWTANGKSCKYLAVFNTRTKEKRIKVSLADFLMPDETYCVYDIWNKEKLGHFKNSVSVEVEPHGARLFKIEQ